LTGSKGKSAGAGQSLEDQAALLLLGLGEEGGTGGVLEDLLDTISRPGRALEVLVGANLLRDGGTLLLGHGLLLVLGQLLNGLGVVPQVPLAANQDDGEALAKVENLRDPLLLDILQGIWVVYGEAHEDHM